MYLKHHWWNVDSNMIPLMISRRWFKQKLGIFTERAITWTNVLPDLCCHSELAIIIVQINRQRSLCDWLLSLGVPILVLFTIYIRTRVKLVSNAWLLVTMMQSVVCPSTVGNHYDDCTPLDVCSRDLGRSEENDMINIIEAWSNFLAPVTTGNPYFNRML